MSVLKSSYAYFLATGLRARHIMRFLKPVSDDVVLDGGCGIGYFSARIKNTVSYIAGVDIDQASLTSAKAFAGGDFVRADVRVLPFKNDAFNKVLLTEILEHLENEARALDEVKRVARNGAEVVITVPCTEGLLSFTPLRLLGHDKPGIEFHHRYGYSKKQMSELLTRHGFAVEKTLYSTGVLSEIAVQLSKAAFLLKKKDFSGQSDMASIERSLLFRLYKACIFPMLYAIGIFEDACINPLLKGHILIVKARIQK
jgi:ubiquinone/menaquinone biosynthesis C-methylase UbiE